MPESLRRHLASAAAGLAAGLVLLPAPGALLAAGPAAVETVLHLGLAAALGVVLGALVEQTGGSVAANLSRGLVLGLLWWLLAALTLEPLLDGRGPTWETEEAAAALPALIGDLLLGGLAGLLLALLPSRSPAASPADPVVRTRVLVLGGGFGGVAAARRLERRFARDPGVEISLVSAGNSLLFTPMLAEVASSALEAPPAGALVGAGAVGAHPSSSR